MADGPKTRWRADARAGAVCFALMLAGCGGGTASLAVFDLTAPADARSGRGGGQIVVAEPQALAVYETDRIVVRSAGVLSVLPGAQFSDRLPRLLQTRIIQTFENGSRSASVGRPADRLVARIQVIAEIRAFEIDADANEAVVTLSVKVVAEQAGRILRAQVFTAREPVAAIAAPAAPQALDRALSRVLRQVVAWAG